MALFTGKQNVFGPELISVGDFDPREDSCYRNVVVTRIDVKPKRLLYLHARSDFPVDIVMLNEGGRPIGHIFNVTEGELGPISTETCNEMAFTLGVFRGDKAKVEVEVWAVKK
ncbi:MAG TPA: hypothetical protein VJY42_00720 [Candidatus Methanomethylophilaceae archaeon]|nr:hypothetical protein [Candidatus Methanomethylophilaceae archaeon]